MSSPNLSPVPRHVMGCLLIAYTLHCTRWRTIIIASSQIPHKLHSVSPCLRYFAPWTNGDGMRRAFSMNSCFGNPGRRFHLASCSPLPDSDSTAVGHDALVSFSFPGITPSCLNAHRARIRPLTTLHERLTGLAFCRWIQSNSSPFTKAVSHDLATITQRSRRIPSPLLSNHARATKTIH